MPLESAQTFTKFFVGPWAYTRDFTEGESGDQEPSVKMSTQSVPTTVYGCLNRTVATVYEAKLILNYNNVIQFHLVIDIQCLHHLTAIHHFHIVTAVAGAGMGLG